MGKSSVTNVEATLDRPFNQLSFAARRVAMYRGVVLNWLWITPVQFPPPPFPDQTRLRQVQRPVNTLTTSEDLSPEYRFGTPTAKVRDGDQPVGVESA